MNYVHHNIYLCPQLSITSVHTEGDESEIEPITLLELVCGSLELSHARYAVIDETHSTEGVTVTR